MFSIPPGRFKLLTLLVEITKRRKSLENDTLYPMRLKLDEIPFQSE